MVMYFNGVLMERISLGAFIIALCMLTDNAIVVTEGNEGRYRERRGQDRSDSRSGGAEPVAAFRGDRHRRDRLRGNRAVGGLDGRVLQLPVLGHLHLPGA